MKVKELGTSKNSKTSFVVYPKVAGLPRRYAPRNDGRGVFRGSQLTKAALLVATLAICAQIIIPTGLVPFNLSLLAIFLIGALLTPTYAALSIITYLLLGIIGLPIFAGLSSGLGAILGPTGGYLISYLPMVLVISLLSKRNLILSLLLSIIICHTLGVLWLSYSRQIPIWSAFIVGSLEFLPFDFLKAAIALWLITKKERKPH